MARATASAFAPYGEERVARMERLRFIADVLAVAQAEDADNRSARRTMLAEQMAAMDPEIFPLLLGAFAGPETVPGELLDPGILESLAVPDHTAQPVVGGPHGSAHGRHSGENARMRLVVDIEPGDPRLEPDLLPVLCELRTDLTPENFAAVYEEGHRQGLRYPRPMRASGAWESQAGTSLPRPRRSGSCTSMTS